MRTISIINLKGGCAKTLSSINIAYVLASVHGGRVLLLDNDKQGDASKIMNRHGYERPGTADILTERKIGMSEVIQVTDYEGLDIITANMNLLTARVRNGVCDRRGSSAMPCATWTVKGFIKAPAKPAPAPHRTTAAPVIES